MENLANNTNTTKGESNATVPNTEETNTPVPNTNPLTSYKCLIECAIRRKPNLVGLPGQDPAERVYKIGASLDKRTSGNLKGVNGELEKLYLPQIVSVGANDFGFKAAVDEYWSGISKPVPADEPFLKDHEKGIKIKLEFHVVGKLNKERIDAAVKVEDKVNLLNELLISKFAPIDPTKEGKPKATLTEESVSDFLLLNYALKYSKVANSYEDIDKSPKIDFYVFEKAVSVQNQLNTIELRKKAINLFTSLQGEARKIDAVLLGFDVNPKDFDNETDKLLKIDDLYISSTVMMKRFIALAEDNNWELKLLLNKAIRAAKVENPVNTTSLYYNKVFLGTSLEEAALFLLNTTQGQEIKNSLDKEVQ